MTPIRRYRFLALALVCVFVVNLVGCGGGAGPARHTHESPSLVHPAGTVFPSASAYSGDMDVDGQPTVGDAIKILRIVVGLDGEGNHLASEVDVDTANNPLKPPQRCQDAS